MRRVGTLTSAFTMLALGILLLADTIWNRNFFVSGLNFWPVIIVGLGVEILISWTYIRRKKLSESIRLDGRSLALLFLVGVFSVNFYLSTSRTAQGAEETPTPQDNLFTVKKKSLTLPVQDVSLLPTTKQIVIQNPLGTVEVVGGKGPQLQIEPEVTLYSTGNGSNESLANQLSPYVTVGSTGTVAVRPTRVDESQKTAPGTVNLRVEVPNGYDLIVRNEHGDIKLTYYRGGTDLLAKSGAIAVDQLTGKLKAEDQNGPIAISRVYGDVNVTSEQRGVSVVDVTGKVKINSDSGAITVSKIKGSLDLNASMGEASLDTIDGDIVAFSTSGLLTIKDAGAEVMATVTNGDMKLTGKVLGALTLISTNGTVRMEIPKDSDIGFTGVTNKGVIKGPTKQSPSGGTKPGAYITDKLGNGTIPVMIRSDNGSIFVDVK
ncbi:MAG: DUF4097 family beta strand repeat-containing protein [Tumebacillaceae bacterium]